MLRPQRYHFFSLFFCPLLSGTHTQTTTIIIIIGYGGFFFYLGKLVSCLFRNTPSFVSTIHMHTAPGRAFFSSPDLAHRMGESIGPRVVERDRHT